MELLRRAPAALDGRRGLALTALGLLCVFTACSLLPDRGTGGLAFDHALHVSELELDCSNCHEDCEVEDDPGMPSYDTCAACHEELDEEKEGAARVESLFVDDAFRARHAARLDEEVRFSHLRHVRADLACDSCHGGVASSSRITSAMRVTMADCTACHAERAVAGECSTCHSQVGREWKPANHGHDWEHAHGRCARKDSREPAESCSLCHTTATCASCHLLRSPDDHDAFFRRRGHGLLADADRSRCAVCHEPDSCSRCHEGTRPLSHAGSWGAPRDTHCLGCHEPLAQESCALCHQGTPSHQLGTPKPPDHHPAMNCRQCHGLSAPLPHFDNGSDCNACHP